MKIDSYQVSAQASRSYRKMEETNVSLAAQNGGAAASMAVRVSAVVAEWSAAALEASSSGAQAPDGGVPPDVQGAKSSAVGTARELPASPQELKMRLLENMLSALSNRQFKAGLLSWDFGKRSATSLWTRLYQAYGGSTRMGALRQLSGGGQPVATGMQLRTQRFTHEQESVSYSAQGLVKTADGKTISVDMNLQMSREFVSYAESSLNLTLANPVDPLVINYGGSAASLTQTRYDFDLDVDGKLDSISFAGPGSGFLALDKNGDGTINDGSELFGPQSGSGFGELRAYDTDGNNWIDENDEVFGQLLVWSKDERGNDQLFTLKELGIGAIYLGDVATDFTMQDAGGNTQGVMRSTSFFLTEQGKSGTVHHIDLTV